MTTIISHFTNKLMKVGIITFHNALNAGAILQAYALQTILTSWGHQVEFINYKPIKKYNIKSYISKSPILIFNKWRNIYNGKRYAKRGDFNKVLTLSPQTYLSYKDLTDYPMDYDAYIAGSDQIWNFYTTLSPVYMLDFVPANKKKIAYAASMGQCQYDKSLYESFRSRLMGFDAISLREQSGVDFVKKLLNGEKDVYLTLDPTLLITTNDYDRISQNVKSNVQHYIFSYILADLDKENAEIIDYIKKQLDLNIINVRNPDTCIWLKHAQNIISTPYQWLNYIKNSEFVICSSFHAVVFSLIYHKPFIALVPPNSKDKGGNMRINSLLTKVGIPHRIICHYNERKIKAIIDEQIDWEKVNNSINQLRDSSIAFLKNSLK